jgi:hypothetical protein
MPEQFITMLADLGGTITSLAFAGYLIIYLLKGFEREREIHLNKDRENDTELRILMKESNSTLVATMKETNTVLSEMRVAISELKETIHSQRHN